MNDLRILERKDAKAYRDLRIFSLKESPFAFSDSCNDIMNYPDSYFHEELGISENRKPEQFVLGCFSQEKELVGFVQFKRDCREKALHKSMIHLMYVKPDYRNIGVGEMLINKVIEIAYKINGLEQIHLWVLYSKYGNASNFYIKMGFKRQGTRVRKDLKIGNEYVDAEYMVLYL